MEISFLRFFKKQSVHSFTSEQVLSQAVLGCIAGGTPPPLKPAPGPAISATIHTGGDTIRAVTVGINVPATPNFDIGAAVTVTERGISSGTANVRWTFPG